MEIAEMLIAAGADVLHTDKSGMVGDKDERVPGTPYMSACKGGHHVMVALMIQHGFEAGMIEEEHCEAMLATVDKEMVGRAKAASKAETVPQMRELRDINKDEADL
jgi:hypothetical protein